MFFLIYYLVVSMIRENSIKSKDKKTIPKTIHDLVDEKIERTKNEERKSRQEFLKTLEGQDLPKVGDIIKGKVFDVSKNTVWVDLGIFGFGTVRGPELWEAADVYTDLKKGDEVEAQILETENELGYYELSFRKTSFDQAWKELALKKEKKEIVTCKIQGANKGGLLTSIYGIPAFLPVSHLSAEHYPKVEGGDSYKILEALQKFVGKRMEVKIITADRKEQKLIVSEKEIEREAQKKKIKKLKIGKIIEGEVTRIMDFGALVKFFWPPEGKDEFEGLVHISELSWKKVKSPMDILKVGDKVKAEIIGLDDSKIILSIKRLQEDPWQEAVKKYRIGQIVEGEISEIKPFGAFVQLDKDIQGLVHISEISSKSKIDISKVLKVGQRKKFKILSIEPEDHRLGLSLRALEEEKGKKKTNKKEQEKKEKKEENRSEK